ncbi:MAG: hypothetical protein ACXVZX_16575 [Terriglobales bacterium]
MGKDISDQYEVTYDSTHPDGKEHYIAVRGLDESLVVRGPERHVTPKLP